MFVKRIPSFEFSHTRRNNFKDFLSASSAFFLVVILFIIANTEFVSAGSKAAENQCSLLSNNNLYSIETGLAVLITWFKFLNK